MSVNPLNPLHTCIAKGRIIEAQSLLDALPDDILTAHERQNLAEQITSRRNRAERLFTQAEALEQAGQAAEARDAYQSVLQEVADFPGIQNHVGRMEEALLLTRAVQRRTRRVRETRSPDHGSAPAGGRKRRGLLLLGAGLVMGAGLAAAVLLSPFSGVKQSPSQPVSPEKAGGAGTQAPAPPRSEPLSNSDATGAETMVTASSIATPAPPLPDPVQDAEPDTPSASGAAAENQTSPPPQTPPMPASDAMEPAAPAPAANRKQPATAPVPALPEARRLYRVRSNDSLSLIAQRLLCDRDLWLEIYRKNRGTIANPEHVLPGMVLDLTGIETRCQRSANAGN